MVEYTDGFGSRLSGAKALGQRVLNRLAVRKGEIPYFPGGLDVSEFAYDGELEMRVSRLLSDLGARVSVSGGRVVLGDVSVPLEGLLDG